MTRQSPGSQGCPSAARTSKASSHASASAADRVLADIYTRSGFVSCLHIDVGGAASRPWVRFLPDLMVRAILNGQGCAATQSWCGAHARREETDGTGRRQRRTGHRGQAPRAPARIRAACPRAGPRPPKDACHLLGLPALRSGAKQRWCRSPPAAVCEREEPGCASLRRLTSSAAW